MEKTLNYLFETYCQIDLNSTHSELCLRVNGKAFKNKTMK